MSIPLHELVESVDDEQSFLNFVRALMQDRINAALRKAAGK